MAEKIGCSRGHVYDLSNFRDRWNLMGRIAGTRCPMVMSYDRMSGTCYCQRILKEVDGDGNILIKGKKILIDG